MHFSKVLKTLEKCIFCIGTIRKFLHGFLEGVVFQNVKTDPMICRTIPAKQRRLTAFVRNPRHTGID